MSLDSISQVSHHDSPLLCARWLRWLDLRHYNFVAVFPGSQEPCPKIICNGKVSMSSSVGDVF